VSWFNAKTWGTIKLTVLVLWLVWPVYTFIEYLILPQIFLGQLMPGYGQLGSVGTVVVGIAGSAFFAFVWTINMLQSPRLAATFSKPER
jgi:hypothetical protein